MAGGMGLRAFDASLIIAIVQDAARSGRSPVGPATEGSLSLVHHGLPSGTVSERVMGLMLASACLGGVIFTLLVTWIGVA